MHTPPVSRRLSLRLLLTLFLVLMVRPSLAVPQTADAAAAPATTQPETVIRSTARLVQISVVVQDKKGNPITGLKKEDFSISDQGKAQNLAFFSAEAPAQATAPTPLPSNVFTNRLDLKGQDPGAVTVILFDSLNTSPQDQSFVRKQVLGFLKTVKPQDHVALYALTTQLLILHDFTQDASALVEGASRFTPKEQAAFDASTTPEIDLVHLGADPQWQRLQDSLNNANGIIADQNTLNRQGTTVAALEAIASHVAGIPGRKSLIWVSGGIPIQIGVGLTGSSGTNHLTTTTSTGNGRGAQAQDRDASVGLPGADRESANSSDGALKLAAQALNQVDMAVYAVDAHGVEVATGMDTSSRGALTAAPLSSTSGFFGRQDMRDSSKLLADQTGGLAFFGNNDIRDAMHHVFDDERYAYTLGFYPDHGDWNGKFREIKIRVKADGAQVRYRKGYFALANRSDSEDAIKTALTNAAESPLDATNIAMIVSGKAVEPISARNLELHIGLDPKQLLLQNSQDHRKGAVDLFFLQRDSAGTTLATEKQHINVDLGEKQYEYLSRAAMVLDRHITVHSRATEIRVVVRDAGAGTVGSVAMPITAFFRAEVAPAAPEKKPD
jgi:VWFA-related protein